MIDISNNETTLSSNNISIPVHDNINGMPVHELEPALDNYNETTRSVGGSPSTELGVVTSVDGLINNYNSSTTAMYDAMNDTIESTVSDYSNMYKANHSSFNNVRDMLNSTITDSDATSSSMYDIGITFLAISGFILFGLLVIFCHQYNKRLRRQEYCHYESRVGEIGHGKAHSIKVNNDHLLLEDKKEKMNDCSSTDRPVSRHTFI